MKTEIYDKRIQSLLPLPHLRSNPPTFIVGVGSGGGHVAVELGRLGVPLLLIDLEDELLLEHNVVRHVLDRRSLGKPKLTEMRACIRRFYPRSRILIRAMDVTAQKHELARLVAQYHPPLIAVCTDNEQSRHAVNEVAVRFHVPTVGAGVYDGGIGGEVYWTHPHRACYGCIADELGIKRPDNPTQPSIDYNSLNTDEIRSTCALHLDIQQITLIQARVSLNILLAGEVDLLGLSPEVNLCVFANRIVPGLFQRPLHPSFFAVARRPGCLICGSRGKDVSNEHAQILADLSGTALKASPCLPGSSRDPESTSHSPSD